jgi:hypothetical protein
VNFKRQVILLKLRLQKRITKSKQNHNTTEQHHTKKYLAQKQNGCKIVYQRGNTMHHCKDKTQASFVLNETVFWQKRILMLPVANFCNKRQNKTTKKLANSIKKIPLQVQ